MKRTLVGVTALALSFVPWASTANTMQEPAPSPKAAEPAAVPNPDDPGPTLAEEVAALTGAGSINQTDEKYQVMGTDLGTMWDNGNGQILMAFGDTFGEGHQGGGNFGGDWRCNTLARSSDRDLSDGMTFDDMVVDEPGHAKQLLDCKQSDQDELTVIPNSGVSVGDRQYMHYFSLSHWGPWNTNYGGIAYSDDNGETWHKSEVRWQNSAQWDRYFQIGALVRHDGYVYLFGTTNDRTGGLKLARVREGDVLHMNAWRYWDGARWVPNESAAAHILTGPTGELTVQYNTYLGRWVMMHAHPYREVIVIREATSLTGPWSGQRVVVRGGPEGEYPGHYAPFIHPWSASSGDRDLYFAMSKWGPYNVYLMRTQLDRNVDSANLISDPGFEQQGDNRVTDPWYVRGRGGIDRDGAFSHDGENNGFVRKADGWNALTQAVAVRPHGKYRLTAWARSADVTKLGAIGVRSGSKVVAERQFDHLAEYTKLTVEFTAGQQSVVEVFAGFQGAGVDSWVQIDDVRLVER